MRRLPVAKKSGPISIRLSPRLRDMLRAMAVENARSLSHEIEMRLSRSFDLDEVRSIIRDEMRAGEAA